MISDMTGTRYSSGVVRVTLSCDSRYDHAKNAMAPGNTPNYIAVA